MVMIMCVVLIVCFVWVVDGFLVLFGCGVGILFVYLLLRVVLCGWFYLDRILKMNQVLWIVKIGLDVQQMCMLVVFNNFVNINIIGFKQDCVSFEDLLYQQVWQLGGFLLVQMQLLIGLQLGIGVCVVVIVKNFEQGGQQQIGCVLDVMVNGRGFFEVQMFDGSLVYICDGLFKINQDSELVINSGYLVQLGIQIFEGVQLVIIGSDGIISVKMVDNVVLVEVGVLILIDFVNLVGLQVCGENLFLEIMVLGLVQNGNFGLNGFGIVVQGVLEGSNVNVVEELVLMIEIQCVYEMNVKVIFIIDLMFGYFNNKI